MGKKLLSFLSRVILKSRNVNTCKSRNQCMCMCVWKRSSPFLPQQEAAQVQLVQLLGRELPRGRHGHGGGSSPPAEAWGGAGRGGEVRQGKGEGEGSGGNLSFLLPRLLLFPVFFASIILFPCYWSSSVTFLLKIYGISLSVFSYRIFSQLFFYLNSFISFSAPFMHLQFFFFYLNFTTSTSALFFYSIAIPCFSFYL